MQPDAHPAVLAQLVHQARTRLRINDALRILARGLPLVLVILCASLAVRKLATLPAAASSALGWLVLAASTSVLIAAGHAAFRRAPWQRAALALDRHYALHDGLTSALEFQQRPSAQRNALMQLCIEQATLAARGLDVKRAVPLRLPRELLYSLLLVSLIVALDRMQVKAVVPPVVVTTPENTTSFVAEADDLQLMREMAGEWQQTATSRESKEVAQRFNQLVMDIAAGKLDRHQVLERLQALQQSLSPLQHQDALEMGLEGLARALESNPSTKRMAQALASKDLNDAEQALRELADKLKNKTGFDKKQLEALRKALQTASLQNAQRSEQLAQARADAETARERLLKKKQGSDNANSNAAAGELAKQERQLEQLRREQRKAAQAQEQMSELDRQLAEAARKLFEESGGAAQALQEGANDLARMKQQRLSEQEKEALKKQLEALRELVRQQGKAGESQKQRYREFSRRANGGKDPAGNGAIQRLRLGAGGVLIPGAATPSSAMQGGAQGEPKPGQSGQSPSGAMPSDQHGTGTDANLKGNANPLQGRTQDVTAAGIDTGQGPSASSVVFGAAERGFGGGDYKRIYTEYKTVAEETLEQDQVPAGYEGHVRRYFQLIRPRD